jgi:glycosyltransferase involved in cell wall biosynthesis
MHIGLILYGSIDTLSGGYLYDRMLVSALEASGHRVSLFSRPWRAYPHHLTDNWNRDWGRRLMAAPVDLWLQDELNHPSLFWLNRALRRHHPAPIVAIVHHLRSEEEHPPSLLPIYRCIERAYLATVDAHLANSHTTHASICALLPSPRPTHVAWPAADHLYAPAEIDAAAIAARAMLADRLRILFVGNLIPRKGLHHLLDALALVDGSWELSVIGQFAPFDGYANIVRRKIARLNLGHRIRFLGRVTDDALIEHYRSHHVLAVPSYEGFGIVYLEAQRFGLPVIALTVGAAHEVLFDGKSGWLVPPGDAHALSAAIRRFVENRDLLMAMGLAARLRYTLHPTWSQSMAGAVRWLETVTKRR